MFLNKNNTESIGYKVERHKLTGKRKFEIQTILTAEIYILRHETKVFIYPNTHGVISNQVFHSKIIIIFLLNLITSTRK